MKTAAVYAPVTDPKISLDYGNLPSASSNPKAYAVPHKKCDSLPAMYAGSLTVCE